MWERREGEKANVREGRNDALLYTIDPPAEISKKKDDQTMSAVLSMSHLFAIDHLFAILSGKLNLGPILLFFSLIIFINIYQSYTQIPRAIREKLTELDDF